MAVGPRRRAAAPARAVGDPARGRRARASAATPARSRAGRCARATRWSSSPRGSRTRVTAIELLDRRLESATPPGLRRGADRRRPRRGPRRPDHGRRPTRRRSAARSRRRCAGWRRRRCAPADRFTLKHTTRTMRATVDSIVHLLDVTTLERVDPPEQLVAQRHRARGAAHERAAARGPLRPQPHDGRLHPHRRPHERHGRRRPGARRSARARRTPTAARTSPGTRAAWTARRAGRRSARKGATVWLTGLPASGKSTIGATLERRLIEAGRPAYFLDGDNIRHGLSGDLGFSPGRPAGEHPPRRPRRAADGRLGDGGHRLAHLALRAPTARSRASCTRRRGCRSSRSTSTRRWRCASSATRRASTRGRGPASCAGSPAISAPYEPPETPEILVHGAEEAPDDAIGRLLAELDRHCHGGDRWEPQSTPPSGRPPVGAVSMEGRARPPRDRPPRLRRVLRVRRAAAAARAARQAGRGGGQRAARGGDHRELRGAPLRRRLGVARRPRRAGCARRPSSFRPTSRPTARCRARCGRSCGERLPVVQQVGLDEGYADLTDVPRPLPALRELVAEVADRTGITISVGVGAQPARRQGGERPREAARLRGHGARGGLPAPGRPAAADHPRHRPEDGRAAGRARLHHHRRAAARARRSCSPSASAPTTGATCIAARTSTARRVVEPETGPAKSRSNETTFDRDIADLAELEAVLVRLAGELAEGLRRKAGAGAHDGHQGPARRLDHGDARAHAPARRRRRGHGDAAWPSSSCAPTRRRAPSGCSACGSPRSRIPPPRRWMRGSSRCRCDGRPGAALSA